MLMTRMDMPITSRHGSALFLMIAHSAKHFPAVLDKAITVRQAVVLSAFGMAHNEDARAALEERLKLPAPAVQQLQLRLARAAREIVRDARLG
ncbi:hypothetical protein [Salinarimonas soli]|uniref:Uncharacterized protein n=1 Tax=Salinarimonas soli TaxID=1638099 RepID=A0A5B2VF56_9HYPH|nr:hypothetical protein [Salinarimonas soli]KAA2237070.1 hypothetical protein F0L46_11440 [Salinarimonas soli]